MNRPNVLDSSHRPSDPQQHILVTIYCSFCIAKRKKKTYTHFCFTHICLQVTMAALLTGTIQAMGFTQAGISAGKLWLLSRALQHGIKVLEYIMGIKPNVHSDNNESMVM